MIDYKFVFIRLLIWGKKTLQDSDLVELEKTVEPSWPKLVEPLEKMLDRLSVVWGAVNHLKSVKDTPELRSAIEEIQVYFYYFWLI